MFDLHDPATIYPMHGGGMNGTRLKSLSIRSAGLLTLAIITLSFGQLLATAAEPQASASEAAGEVDVAKLIQEAALNTVRGKHVEAEACYRKVLEAMGDSDPSSVQITALLANAIEKQGNRKDEAIDLLEAALKKHGAALGDENEEIMAMTNTLARMCRERSWGLSHQAGRTDEEYKEAERLALRANELQPDTPNWSMVAYARFRLGDAEGSRSAMLKSLARRRESWTGQWFLMAMVEHLNGDARAARDWFAAGYEWMQRTNNTWDPNRQMRFRAASLVDAAAMDLPEEWEPEAYLPHYDRLVERHPNMPRLVQRRGLVNGAVGNREQAMLDYAQAIQLYSKAIQLDPDDTGAKDQRAYLQARIGRWAELARDVQVDDAAETADTIVMLRFAAILAAAGDKAKYRVFCNKIIERFRESDNRMTIERVIKSSLLLPGVVQVSDLSIDELVEALKDDENAGAFKGWGWSGLALAEYRAGDPSAALQSVARAEAADNFSEQPGMQALALCVKALACHELKRDEDARQAHATAKAILETAAEEAFRNGTWSHDVLIAQILCKEVRGRLANTKR